ncbi:MAG: hypothetical protein ACT4PT_02205 [Methanobacteriota archaeon]
MRLHLSLVIVSALIVAGCVTPASEEPVATAAEGDAAATAAAVTGLAAAPTVLAWEGYMAAGALFEAPAHFKETEALVSPIWKSGFNLHVEELPSVIEIQLDWTAASPSQVMMMAHVPNDAENTRYWVEYEYPHQHATAPMWPTEGPLCMRITTDELAPGHWHIMAHSRYGSDIKLAFAVTTVGGVVSIPEGAHGHVVDAEEVQQIAMAVEPRDWEPCELSG